MKRINILICALVLSQAAWTGCKDDKFEKTIFDDEPEQLNEVGQWVYDNWVVPYNMEILYRWRDNETDLRLNLTPPRQDTVIPFLRMMHTGFITPYLELCGREQMKPIFPKQVQLFGSAGYNPNGSVVSGTADGGKKLILHDLDNFNPKLRDTPPPHMPPGVKDFIRVMHHEFGHLLNQAKEYQPTFKKITPDTYTTEWGPISLADALEAGYVSNYAMSMPDEDFVETLAEYVTDTPEEWAELLSSIPRRPGETPPGEVFILRKLDLVRTYMEENYGVDIDVLRDVVIQRIDNVVAGNY